MSWVPLAASAVSGAMDFFGSSKSNRENRKEAQRNRDWQTEMANTAHFREVKDLTSAGLNPMLSVMGGSGAATPSSPIPTMQNTMSGASDKANAAIINSATADNIKANTAKTQADTINTQANTAKTLEDTKNVPLQGKLIQNQAYKISHEIPQILRQGNLTDAQTQQAQQITSNLLLQPALTKAQTSEALARANLTTEQIRKIAPEILNLHAQTRLTNSKVGYEEMFSLPGDVADRFFSNSAKDSTRSSTANALGSTPRYVQDKLNELTDNVRKQRKQLDKERGRK